MPQKPLKLALAALKYGIVLLAVGYLLHSGKLNFSEVEFTAGSAPWLALAVLLLALPNLIALARWQLLLRGLGVKISWFAILRFTAIGLFFNTFLLGSFGGDFIKLAYIVCETDRRAAAAASILVDRVCGLLGLLFIGGATIVLFWQQVLDTPSLHLLALALFAALAGTGLCLASAFVAIVAHRAWAVAGCAALLFLQGIFIWHKTQSEGPLTDLSAYAHAALSADLLLAAFTAVLVPSLLPGHRLHSFVRSKLPLGNLAMSFIEAVLSYRSAPRCIGAALVLSVLTQGFAILSICAVAWAIGSEAGAVHMFFAAPVTLVANILPVPMGGLGIGENVFDALLSLCRTDAGAAVTGGAVVFLAWRSITYLFNLVIGLPFYLAGKKEISELKNEISPG